MFDAPQTTGTTSQTGETTAPSTKTNVPTEAELLDRAKAAVEANDQSLREAAEALAETKELHRTSQAEMSRAIGKSEAWVSKLLKWRKRGYKDKSPFGPTTKDGRLEHAQDRAGSGVSKPRKLHKPNIQPKEEDDDAEASANRRKAEYAKLDAPDDAAASAGRSSTDTHTKTPTSKNAKASARALAEFKIAVNLYVPPMDQAAVAEAKDYFLAKAGLEA